MRCNDNGLILLLISRCNSIRPSLWRMSIGIVFAPSWFPMFNLELNDRLFRSKLYYSLFERDKKIVKIVERKQKGDIENRDRVIPFRMGLNSKVYQSFRDQRLFSRWSRAIPPDPRSDLRIKNRRSLSSRSRHRKFWRDDSGSTMRTCEISIRNWRESLGAYQRVPSTSKVTTRLIETTRSNPVLFSLRSGLIVTALARNLQERSLRSRFDHLLAKSIPADHVGRKQRQTMLHLYLLFVYRYHICTIFIFSRSHCRNPIQVIAYLFFVST